MKYYIFKSIFTFLSFVIISQSYGQSTRVMYFYIRYDNPNDTDNSLDNRKKETANLIEHYHPDFLGIHEGSLNQVEYIKEDTTLI